MRPLILRSMIRIACGLCVLVVLLSRPGQVFSQTFSSFSAGGAHSLGVKADGTLWAWGLADSGQLGLGYIESTYSGYFCRIAPVLVDEGYAAVSAGAAHSLGLKTGGALWAWGDNTEGQLGAGSEWMEPGPIFVGEGYSAISAGNEHSLALKENGALWAWGANDHGQLGGGGTESSRLPVYVGDGFAAISAGGEHSLALKEDGALWVWGSNSRGQLGDGTTTDSHVPIQVGEDFIAVSAGWSHSLGLKADGSLWAWGGNVYGQIGDGSTEDRPLPVLIGEDFRAMAAGSGHSLGLKADGSLWSWGYNSRGQLGDGTTTDRSEPVQVGEGFGEISAGGNHSLGLKTDGSLWAWGYNFAGQLGDATQTDSSVPVLVGGPHSLYYVPYAPAAADFTLGFGIANADSENTADVYVEYLSNEGVVTGHDYACIPASGHASFMSASDHAGSGWARITATREIRGMSLVFGYGQDPLFDMDIKNASDLADDLSTAHVDNQGWVSKAMLANPNGVEANVEVTFQPDNGILQTASLTIPPMGAVQYDLSAAFPGLAGYARFKSDTGILGFLLYDGRGLEGGSGDCNYAGGLFMWPSALFFEKIAGGSRFSLGMKDDGSLWGWGFNYYGQLGDGTRTDRHNPALVGEDFSTVSCGSASLGLKTDGSLWAWGGNNNIQENDPAGLIPNPVLFGTFYGEWKYSAMARGSGHILALKPDGSLWAWGDNSYGQLGDGARTDRIYPIKVGDGFTAIAAGSSFSLGLKADGTLWFWGGMMDEKHKYVYRLSPFQVGEGFSAIAGYGAGWHLLALKADGSLWAMGGNNMGQLGDGTRINRTSLVQVGDGFSAMAAGGLHSLGLKSDGSLWAWGSNKNGELGGTMSEQLVPVQVGRGFAAIAAGGATADVCHSLGLKTNGVLWAWGDDSFSQLGLGSLRLNSNLLGNGNSPGTEADYVYCVPYLPAAEEFALGYGISNSDGNDPAEMTVEYFSNSGEALGQESRTIPAGGHASFMSGLNPAESGWVRISSDRRLYGAALAFGHGTDPMFDMDFKMYDSWKLIAPHVDRSGGWISKAMLANPNAQRAHLSITFHPDNGGAGQTVKMEIPAMGAIQDDLSAFWYSKGAIEIDSDQGLVGFLLYDGRATGYNYVGGLSMESVQ